MTDEKELMFQVKAGRLDKLAILFESNKVQLYNYFLRSGSQRALSEDLVQETFMRILAYRTSFQGSSSFKSWMYGIARNTRADHYRKNNSQNQHCDIDEQEIATEFTLTEDVELDQQQMLFTKSLETLPREHREIIILSRFQQLNYQEIASLLDCNLNTLKARMRKAISILQDNYQQLTGGSAHES